MIDIGTGDGRFVSAAARSNPNKFFIGIDANVKPLEKLSMKATRKPAKGGLPNALFVQAAVENLPEELNGVADKIHVHFPWGSLLKAVAHGDEAVLHSLRRISAPAGMLEIVIGLDAQRDAIEIERLKLPQLSAEYLRSTLFPKYAAAGFEKVEHRILERSSWTKIQSSWARKLKNSESRLVFHILFKAL